MEETLRNAGAREKRALRRVAGSEETNAPQKETACKKKKVAPPLRVVGLPLSRRVVSGSDYQVKSRLPSTSRAAETREKSAQMEKAANMNKKKPAPPPHSVITLESSESSSESDLEEEEEEEEDSSETEMEDQDGNRAESTRPEHQGTSEPPLSASTIKFNFNAAPSFFSDSFEKRRHEESVSREESKIAAANRMEKRRESSSRPIVKTMEAREKRRLQNLEKHLRMYGEISSDYHSACRQLEEDLRRRKTQGLDEEPEVIFDSRSSRRQGLLEGSRQQEKAVRTEENQGRKEESPEPEVIFDSRSSNRPDSEIPGTSSRRHDARRQKHPEPEELLRRRLEYLGRRERIETITRYHNSIIRCRREGRRHDARRSEIEKRQETDTKHKEMKIPANSILKIIGEEGANIKHIRSTFGVDITILRPHEPGGKTASVLMTGDPCKILMARKHIKSILGGRRINTES
ncbi:hypothetical protein CRE_14300 [Caenorhabditis remanei]|uniref:K Homology domain-containing protein n=1 Tax=Caenorhabditis remanei TaxID=31234 RepID=E3NEX5_CAERE|nr:hypothetical protein CRE_14300 [Caenorhabditis remanei]